MPNTPDFRALCAELVDELNYHADEHSVDKLIARATAALATPPPKPPLDEEILELAGDVWISFAKSQPNPQRYSWDLVLIRAALERWGK